MQEARIYNIKLKTIHLVIRWGFLLPLVLQEFVQIGMGVPELVNKDTPNITPFGSSMWNTFILLPYILLAILAGLSNYMEPPGKKTNTVYTFMAITFGLILYAVKAACFWRFYHKYNGAPWDDSDITVVAQLLRHAEWINHIFLNIFGCFLIPLFFISMIFQPD